MVITGVNFSSGIFLCPRPHCSLITIELLHEQKTRRESAENDRAYFITNLEYFWLLIFITGNYTKDQNINIESESCMPYHLVTRVPFCI